MVTIAYIVAILFMVFLPLIFSFSLVRKYGTPWMVFGMGGLAFLVAEIVRSPVTTWITGSDTFINASKGWEIIYVILFYGLIISVFQNLTRYGAFRLAGAQGKTWGGGVTVAAGFATLNLVLIFGLNALMTLVYVITFPSTAPDGVTAQEFATMQQQVGDFWNASFLNAIVQAQIIPGLWQFTLQFAVTMVVWVGMVQKKWLWFLSAFLYQLAMTAVYSVVGNWMLLYLVNAQEYALNMVLGALIFIALMVFNGVIVYFIYKKVSPLVPEFVPVITPPMPGRANKNALPAREKSAAEIKPAKKLKNTDLK